MTPRSFAGLAALGGTVALVGGAADLGTFTASPIENTAKPIVDRAPAPAEPDVVTAAIPLSAAAPDNSSPPEPASTPAASSAAEVPAIQTPAVQTPAVQTPAVQTPAVQMLAVETPAAETAAVAPVSTEAGAQAPTDTGMALASLAPSEPVVEGPNPLARAIEPPGECATDTCVDAYLWSLYERTPKIDTIKVPHRIKVTVKKKGKTRTVTQTVVTYALDDFTWKDPVAAQRAGMSLMDYVIGGMDHRFKRKLYHALRALDEAGFMPGITSGFRDDYRQSLASGIKAASDSSFHGGSRRGGYGHGLAADIVSVKGDTRMERYAASDEMWKWIDTHDKELGIGRPYLDHDPPHVGPTNGAEYIVKRALANVRRRALLAKAAEKTRLETTRRQPRNDTDATKRATPAKLSKPAKTAHGHRTPRAA